MAADSTTEATFMHPTLATNNQRGFSLIEMLIAVTVMIVLTSGVVTLLRGSMMITKATYEMTDAQENLRTTQEYINRDLMNAGDGLRSISMIRVPTTFVNNYLTLTPIQDPLDAMPTGQINLGILTSDNNVPSGTSALGASPADTVSTGTDRQTILEVDSTFTAIPIGSGSIDSTGTVVTLPSGTTMTNVFTAGEIYYFSSSQGGTFATLTGVNTGSRQLTFSTDTYGLNLSGSANLIKSISNSGVLATSLQRMKMIHYYVNSSGYLMRRVFGAKCAPSPAVCSGFRESTIAEHVVNVQFVYSLEKTDSAGNVVQPKATLSSKEERLGVRQVEVTVTVETPHALQNGQKSTLAGTTSTSVRNMQFRQARQPS
jgi:prepilin-type N-terminal cleavage/methylation domain-containing protein